MTFSMYWCIKSKSHIKYPVYADTTIYKPTPVYNFSHKEDLFLLHQMIKRNDILSGLVLLRLRRLYGFHFLPPLFGHCLCHARKSLCAVPCTVSGKHSLVLLTMLMRVRSRRAPCCGRFYDVCRVQRRYTALPQ